MIESIDPFKEWDAAYLLGALSQEERLAYEKHLSSCSSCTGALAAISHIPEYLGRIDMQTAMSLNIEVTEDATESAWDDSEIIRRLAMRAAGVRQKERSRQKLGLVAAVVISLTVGVTAGVVSHSQDTRSEVVSNSTGVSLHVTNLHPEVMTALFRVTSKDWGTQIDWSCTYSSGVSARYSSTKYDLLITDTLGHQSIVSTWSASGSTATGLAVTSELPLSHIKSVQIALSGSKIPLVVGTSIQRPLSKGVL